MSTFCLGGGFNHFLFLQIITWGNDPIWRAFFSNGLKFNHKLDKVILANCWWVKPLFL